MTQLWRLKVASGVKRAWVLTAVMGLAGLAWGQLPPSSDSPPPSTSPAGSQPDDQDQQPITTFKASASIVSLYFTVRDKHNALVPNLAQSDCTVLEDKVPQKLKTFTAVEDQKLTLGILLDTSGSQERVLPMEQKVGAQFLERILHREDEAFLISFDIHSDLLSDFTNSPRQLKRAMEEAKINDGGGLQGMGPVPQTKLKGTVLYDAVYLASHDKLTQETGRKALILLTDGQDEGSEETLRGAIEAAQRSDAMVYVLLIADRDGYGNFGYTGESAMRKMAEETGGRVFNVGGNQQKLEDAFAQIEAELRTQYLASYVPVSSLRGQVTADDDAVKARGPEKKENAYQRGYRRIDIQCQGDGLKVQARKGYYAVSQGN